MKTDEELKAQFRALSPGSPIPAKGTELGDAFVRLIMPATTPDEVEALETENLKKRFMGEVMKLVRLSEFDELTAQDYGALFSYMSCDMYEGAIITAEEECQDGWR